MVEHETKKRIQTLRTDRGGEFVSLEFNAYYHEKGIKRHLTAPYSPQQNGVVERRNRTLMEMTRSIMKHMSVANYLWREAVRHSTYLLNRIAARVIRDRTPYEALRGVKPNIGHLRVFGCIGYAKVEAKLLKKLDDRSRILVHLGTEHGSKAYRMFDPNTKRILMSRDVVFDETKRWNWSSNLYGQGDTGSFKIMIGVFGNHGIHETEPKTEQSVVEEDDEVISQDKEDDEDDLGEGNGFEEGGLRRSSRATRKTKVLRGLHYVTIRRRR